MIIAIFSVFTFVCSPPSMMAPYGYLYIDYGPWQTYHYAGSKCAGKA